MKQINIGGVPEHFNLAWHLTLQDDLYKKEGVDLSWHDFPGGTGAMCNALKEKKIDVAVILTEGIIKAIIDGNQSKIIQTYVQTPLNWGIHVSNNSLYKEVSDLKGTKAAISRYGSGSHLMSYINAKNHDWDLKNDLKFEVINDLDGAVAALTSAKADYFLWEKFMTKPLVDKGVFRRIGNCPSPWPCFVIAARKDIIESCTPELKTILKVINQATIQFKSIPNIDTIIANTYDQQLEDVREWLSLTEWSQELITEDTLKSAQQQLFDLKIISKTVTCSTLVHEL